MFFGLFEGSIASKETFIVPSCPSVRLFTICACNLAFFTFLLEGNKQTEGLPDGKLPQQAMEVPQSKYYISAV